jgi:predicted RNA-binding Zn-ribbon protein involved in translation (DUF1610 family)
MKQEDIPKCLMCKSNNMKVLVEEEKYYKFECPDCGITMEIKAVKKYEDNDEEEW